MRARQIVTLTDLLIFENRRSAKPVDASGQPVCPHHKLTIMAKQIGIVKISGMIDGLVFYEHPEDGSLVRKQGYKTGDKLKASPDYQHTLDNAAEFTTSIKSGQLLRQSLKPLLFPIADGKLSSRMNKVMLEIVQQDREHGLGKRVAHGSNLTMLEGFEFNRHLALKDCFSAPFQVITDASGAEIHIDIPAFIPASSFTVKPYTKAVKLISGAALIDFELQRFSNNFWQTEMISLDKELVHPIRFSFSLMPEPGKAFFLTLGMQQWVHMDELPKSDISKRKYWMVRKMRDGNKMMAFTGASSVVRVVVGESKREAL